jgi:hypothetical protein
MVRNILKILPKKFIGFFLGFALIFAPIACGENCGVIDDLCSTVEHSLETAGQVDAETGDLEQPAYNCIGCHIQVLSQDHLTSTVSSPIAVMRFATEAESDDPAPHNYLRPPRV